jgi:hypothetical protein
MCSIFDMQSSVTIVQNHRSKAWRCFLTLFSLLNEKDRRLFWAGQFNDEPDHQKLKIQDVTPYCLLVDLVLLDFE